MAKVFTSDLHVEHKNIVGFTKRGADTTQEEHTEFIRKLWNKEVKPSDDVYHMGDFTFSSNYDFISRFVDSLNGQKYFLKGNHCDEKVLDRLVRDGLIHSWYDYKEIKLGDQRIVLFHFPITAWHQQGRGSWHLHGHCHGNLQQKFGKRLDVGLDNAYNLFGEHRFFTEQDIKDFMWAQPLEVSDHHMMKG